MRGGSGPGIWRWLQNALLAWLACMVRPAASWSDIIGTADGAGAKILDAAGLWLTFLVIGMLLQLPVSRLLGFPLHSWSLFVAGNAYFLLALLLAMLAVHAGMRLYGVPSVFEDTLVIYTVTLGSFAPVLSIVACPFLIQLLTAWGTLRSQGASPSAALLDLAQRVSPADALTPGGFYPIHLMWIFGLLFAVLTVLLLNNLGRHYHVPKERATAAVAFSYGVLVPLFLLPLSALFLIILPILG